MDWVTNFTNWLAGLTFIELIGVIAGVITIGSFVITRVNRLNWKYGRFYIGIDVGSNTIDCCILDHQAFLSAKSENEFVKQLDETIDITNPAKIGDFSPVYPKIKELIKELMRRHPECVPISGIGIGLPGMVNPIYGMLNHTPFFSLTNEPFVEYLEDNLDNDWEGIKKLLGQEDKNKMPDDFIKIDNDVRCATRFIWKKGNIKNLVCIFIGNGVGSGIVVNGSMVYGKDFSAGEVGHTTISNVSKLFSSTDGLTKCHCEKAGYHWEMYVSELFSGEFTKCHCKKAGHHWEMYVSSHGIVNMMMYLDSEKFKKFREKYLSEQNNPEFIERECLDENSKFTPRVTYIIRQAYQNGDAYARQIIDEEALKYIAIGVANYVNILNPDRIILGGGIIRAFFRNETVNQEGILRQKVEEYAIQKIDREDFVLRAIEKQEVASIGAALIFKDDSYSEYIRKHTIKKPKG